jgi:hypothetical protein
LAEADRQRITTIVALAIVAFWIVTAVVRIWVAWPAASVLDSAMPLVVGWWFVSSSSAKKNGAAAI